MSVQLKIRGTAITLTQGGGVMCDQEASWYFYQVHTAFHKFSTAIKASQLARIATVPLNSAWQRSYTLPGFHYDNNEVRLTKKTNKSDNVKIDYIKADVKEQFNLFSHLTSTQLISTW